MWLRPGQRAEAIDAESDTEQASNETQEEVKEEKTVPATECVVVHATAW